MNIVDSILRSFLHLQLDIIDCFSRPYRFFLKCHRWIIDQFISTYIYYVLCISYIRIYTSSNENYRKSFNVVMDSYSVHWHRLHVLSRREIRECVPPFNKVPFIADHLNVTNDSIKNLLANECRDWFPQLVHFLFKRTTRFTDTD